MDASINTGAPLYGGIGTISQTGSITQGMYNPEAHNIAAASKKWLCLS